MNDSEFYYKVARNLFFIARSRTLSGPEYYLNLLYKAGRLAINHPQIFIKRLSQALLKRPKGIIDIFTRRYLLQSWTPQSVRLKRTNREYYDWIEKVEQPAIKLNDQKKQAKNFNKRPLISLITPVWNPPVEAHRELIESVLSQTYDNFELMLYNFSDKPELEGAIRDLLDEYAAKDPRVKVKHGLKNEGIAQNSNYCLEFVEGEYVGLLDHDDALEPNALFECVKAINETGAEFVYTDKDMISEEGRRFDPTFKPDWSPEMEMCGNYLTHFDIMLTRLVKDLGGWDGQTNGAQDWDLFWRIVEKTDKIAHVPKIVYHWRTVAGSTSNNISAKPYVLEGQINTIKKHLKYEGIKAEPYHDWTGQLYIDFETRNQPVLFTIHSFYNEVKNIHGLWKQISSQQGFNHNSQFLIFALKGEFKKEDKQKLEDLPNVRMVEYLAGEFAAIYAKAIAAAKIEKVVYLTDSLKKLSKATGQTPWISQLCGWIDVPGIGMAGGLDYAPDGRVVDCGSYFVDGKFYKFYFGTGHRSGYLGHLQWTRNFLLVSERLVAFKASLLTNLARQKSFSGLRDDELIKALAIENFASKQRAVYDPSVTSLDAAPFHVCLKSSDALMSLINSRAAQWDQKDPYFNDNLSPSHGDLKLVNLAAKESAQTSGNEIVSMPGLLAA